MNTQYAFPNGTIFLANINNLKNCLNQNRGSSCILENLATPDGQRPSLVNTAQAGTGLGNARAGPARENFEKIYGESLCAEQRKNNMIIIIIIVIIGLIFFLSKLNN